MEITGSGYKVWHETASSTVYFEGILRLGGMKEYAPISKMLSDVLQSGVDSINLDLTQLEFLNSSGINVFAKFVIAVRKQKTVKMAVRGSNNIPWQKKSLSNLKKLFPALELSVD